jgi:acyl-coenzyme A synthetase/AMP-(fatty) acid ligase
LRRAIESAAARFRSAGVSRGDRVLIIGDNTVTFVVSLLATLKLDAIEITITPDEHSQRIEQILEIAEPQLIVGKANAGWLGPAYTWAGDQQIADETSAIYVRKGTAASEAFAPLAEAGVVSLAFTSGSTGRPKAAALTAAGMQCTVFAAPHLADHRGQRLLLAIPLANSYGKTQLLEFLSVGATVVLRNGFGTPEEAWRVMNSEAVTVVEGPPGVFELLLRSRSLRETGLPRLRRIGMAGGRIRVGMLQALRQLLPDCALTNRYGVTEISGGLCRTVLTEGPLSEPISCGRPFPWVRLRIAGPRGEDLPPGEAGEVWVESPGLMWGYSPQRYDSSVYRTGDYGWITPNGELVLAGRSAEMIKRDGVRISAAEVERALGRHPSVRECVALSWWEPDTGRERLGGIVVPADDNRRPPVHELLGACAQHLPRSHFPDRILFVQSIPLSATGKPDLAAMRAQLARG